MARPLPLPDPHRGSTNGNSAACSVAAGPFHLHSASEEPAHKSVEPLEILAEEEREMPESVTRGRRGSLGHERTASAAEYAEMEHLRGENAQLRALCQELEQALQEASQQLQPDLEHQIGEYEAVLEEKNEMIRELHQQLQETQAALVEAESRAGQPASPSRTHEGKPPCEDELLALSEELERERRQLQEDERTLMDQMREMEVTMARERAEMARQRNDLQRLQNEIRHELERLERDGGIQSKIDSLRSKLHDVTARRGAAPGASTHSSAPAPTPPSPSRKEGLMGRLFGRGGD